MTGYNNLANAIVIQAVNDWSNAVKTINRIKKPKTEKQKEKLLKAKYRKSECEQFFLGGWFALLTGLDGEALLRDLNNNKLPNQARRRNYGKKVD